MPAPLSDLCNLSAHLISNFFLAIFLSDCHTCISEGNYLFRTMQGSWEISDSTGDGAGDGGVATTHTYLLKQT